MQPETANVAVQMQSVNADVAQMQRAKVGVAV